VTEVALRTPVVSEEGLIPTSTTVALEFSVNRRLSAVLTASSPSTSSELVGTLVAVLEFFVIIVGIYPPELKKRGHYAPTSIKG
jgi:hypothetical protein